MQEALNKTKDELAKEGVKELKETSPKSTGRKRSGKYAKSWSKKKKGNAVIIYNKEYQLTHLLEKGHAKVNGGRVEARVHIAPVEKKLSKSAESTFKKLLK